MLSELFPPFIPYILDLYAFRKSLLLDFDRYNVAAPYMRTKSPCPEITSRNAKISTLDPYNFFWLGFVTPYFTTNLVYIYRSFI